MTVRVSSSTARAFGKLTKRRREILEWARDAADSETFVGRIEGKWWTPMMAGGHDGSWHGNVCAQLKRRGLLEVHPIYGSLSNIRRVNMYRITQAGRDAL